MLVGSTDGPLGHALTQDELGFSITHALKRVGHGVVHAASTVEHGAVSAAKAAGKVALLPAKEVIHVVHAALALAFRPVTRRIQTLENRRAAKIAFDKRKATVPTPAERAEAKNWTKNKLKGEGPQGRVLALFAGPPPFIPYNPRAGLLGQDPATVSAMAAAIPAFISLMEKALGKFSKSGEAPAKPGDAPAADPAADAAASAAAAGGDAGADAGGDAAGGDASADAGGGGGKHKGGGGKMMLPGIGAVPKTAVYVGGGILALVLLVALTKKKS